MKTIQLDKHYQNVRGVQLKPGIQDVQDDLAKYLVENGHAVYVDTPSVADVSEDVDVIPHAVPDEPEDTATEERTPQPKRNAKRR